MFPKNLKHYTEPVLKAYSGIFFLPSTKAGLIVFLIALLNPNIGLSGLIAIVSAYLFARFFKFSKTFLSLDYYIYNPLLVGLGIGFLFKLSFLTISLIVVASILTFLLTVALSSALGYYFRLPVLSLPFVIVSVIAYLASYKYSNLFVYYLYPHGILSFANLPDWLKGFFKSLGAILFYPNAFIGMLIFLFLLRFSLIIAFLSFSGYLLGTLLSGILSGNLNAAFGDISAFNYILIAVSLGAVFLIPHPRSYFIAFVSVAISVPIVQASEVFFQNYGIPIFALPFNVVVLTTLYALFVLGYRYLTVRYGGTPEKTLDYFITYQNRFPLTGREIGLPFSGRWTVWQGFNGEWTHKGAWRYALDFVITDEEGKTFRGSGYNLSDYYAYRKPVLSPISGTVVEVVDGFPDNPPGEADKENNWGNYVLIYDWRGFYVLLCHFSPNTIKVKKGDKVERGTLLGLCGNSGYSPQPHIHMHVQLLPKVGSPTVPFVIDSYLNSEGVFFDYSVPQKGEIVEAFYPDKVLQRKFNLLIEEKYKFVFETSRGSTEKTLKVDMAPDGTFYLTDGKGKLYFGQRNGVFYIYSLEGESDILETLFVALSKIPLNISTAKVWRDSLPLDVVARRYLKPIWLFIASFNHNWFEVKTTFEVEDYNRFKLRGSYPFGSFSGEVLIDRNKFVERIYLEMPNGRFLLKRVDF